MIVIRGKRCRKLTDPIPSALIPGYYLSDSVGQLLASLKGLGRIPYVLNLPEFLIEEIKRPRKILLYDSLLIDSDLVDLIKARWTIEEEDILRDFMDSSLIKKIDFSEILKNKMDELRKGFREDCSDRNFKKVVAYIKRKWGDNYAIPDPLHFEAMNINVSLILARELKLSLLDAVERIKLYAYKERNISDTLSIPIIFPKYEVDGVDEFLEIHGDPAIRAFRSAIWHEIRAANETGYYENLGRIIKNLNIEMLERIDQYSILEKLDHISITPDWLGHFVELLSLLVPALGTSPLLKGVSLSIILSQWTARLARFIYRKMKYHEEKLYIHDLTRLL